MSSNVFGLPKSTYIVPAASENLSCEFGSSKYYALCGIGGMLSCGLTHTFVVPLDLVKCRMQVSVCHQSIIILSVY